MNRVGRDSIAARETGIHAHDLLELLLGEGPDDLHRERPIQTARERPIGDAEDVVSAKLSVSTGVVSGKSVLPTEPRENSKP